MTYLRKGKVRRNSKMHDLVVKNVLLYQKQATSSLALLQTHQTTVERRSWLLFLRGARTGSPSSKLARMLPEKQTSMVEAHRARGCFREKGREPGRERLSMSTGSPAHRWPGRP